MPREEADLGALQAMVDWTRFLATRTLPVPEPLPSRRGRWIEAVALGSLSYAALYALQERARRERAWSCTACA